VDGSDFLYLRGGIMWVVHRNYELPGCIIVRIYDSFGNLVNSTSWTPKWYTDQSRRTLYDPSPARCGQTGCLNFATEIFSFSSVVSVDPTSFQALMSRNVLNIFQPPSDLNGFTTVVLFDDDPIGGLASYEFKISYVPFNIFTIDLKLCEDGDDSFYFRSGVMWIVHGNNELPGWHSDCSSQEITVKVFNSNGQPVKSIAWLPNWYTDQSRSTPHSPSVNGCGETGCSGFTSSELVIFPTVIRISPWSFNAVTFRYNASLFQSPSQNNNFTTIVHLDDNPPGGATLYEFKVSYTSQENPPPLLSPVGGDTVLVDKLSLLAPYMGLASVVVAAAVATVYLKRTKRREETQ